MRAVVLVAALIFGGVWANEPEIAEVAVSPAQDQQFLDQLSKIVGPSVNFRPGVKSRSLLLIELASERVTGVFTLGENEVARLSLIDPSGSKYMAVEGASKIKIETILNGDSSELRGMHQAKAKTAALSRLKSSNRKALRALQKFEITDWLGLYDSVFVAKALNRSVGIEHLRKDVYSVGEYRSDYKEMNSFNDLVHQYVALGDVGAVRALLEHIDFFGGDYPSETEMSIQKNGRMAGFPRGNKLIHTAAFSGSHEMFELVLSKYPDIEARNAFGVSVAESTAMSDINMFLAIAKRSLKQAEPYMNMAMMFQVTQIAQGQTGLPSAAGNLLKLFEFGANPNLAALGVLGPIHIAAASGNIPLANFLFRNGAEVTPSESILGGVSSPFTLAIRNGKEDMAFWLIDAGANIHNDAFAAESPLIASIKHPMPVIATRLITQGVDIGTEGNNGWSPLVEAIAAGQSDLARLLIAVGASPNETDNTNRVPLQQALSRGERDLAIELLQNGANPNIRVAEGGPPLHMAAKSRDLDLLEALLAHGADPNKTDKTGLTALFFAYPKESEGIDARNTALISSLMNNGADLEFRNEAGVTADIDYQTKRDAFLEKQYQEQLARIKAQEEAERRRIERDAREERRRVERQIQMAEQRRREKQEKQRRARERDAFIGRMVGVISEGIIQGANEIAETQREINTINQHYEQVRQYNREVEAAKRRADTERQQANYDAARAEAERQRRAAKARHQQQLLEQREKGRRRQMEIYQAVQQMKARKGGATKTNQPSGLVVRGTITRQESRPLSSSQDKFVKDLTSWTDDALAACTDRAERISLEDTTRHSLASAIEAFKIGCHRCWSSNHSGDFNNAPPLFCSTRGTFSQAVGERLSERGIGDHQTYAEQAWDAWQQNLGCR